MNILFLALASLALAQMTTKTELQWAICEPGARSFLQKFDEELSAEGKFKQSYLDTADLAFTKQKVALHRKDSDETSTKVKITFEKKSDADLDWIEENGGKCEFDQYGSKKLFRCQLGNSGEELWSREQLEFLARHGKSTNLSNLKTWGPYAAQTWASKKSKFTFDEVVVPESPPVLELSLRAPPEDYDEITQGLKKNGILLCPKQTGKFERVLGL